MSNNLQTQLGWLHLAVKLSLAVTGGTMDEDFIDLQHLEEVLDLLIMLMHLAANDGDHDGKDKGS